MGLRGNPNLTYLRSSTARRAYTCANCSSLISHGAFYFRDDNLFARLKHGAAARQYCASCVLGKKQGGEGGSRHPSEGAYQLILAFGEQVIIHPTRVKVVDVTEELVRRALSCGAVRLDAFLNFSVSCPNPWSRWPDSTEDQQFPLASNAGVQRCTV